uniref:CSON011087 protein n=1 Tax=Culicoides sonorensis TaxID=179676 RepID=A0A336LR67_CULSO
MLIEMVALQDKTNMKQMDRQHVIKVWVNELQLESKLKHKLLQRHQQDLLSHPKCYPIQEVLLPPPLICVFNSSRNAVAAPCRISHFGLNKFINNFEQNVSKGQSTALPHDPVASGTGSLVNASNLISALVRFLSGSSEFILLQELRRLDGLGVGIDEFD